jgi:hypothetical protein
MHITKENRNKISAYKQRIFAIRHGILEKIVNGQIVWGATIAF